MSNDPAVETLHTVDDRSKVVAVLATLVAFGSGMLTIGDIEFVSIAAAAVGVGVRFASVWWGARAFVDGDSAAIADQPTAGSYHHGAIGIALATAGGLALIARSLGVGASAVAVGAVAVAGVAFLGLSVLLPD
ncbi:MULTISPECIES: hypothetical protein [Halorubrum]|uniref:Uncharacterized protein n=1 Tax=Halorubrum persicum TaxID=1383844 RepID=A0A2G1WIL5_9EURY|nr:hypothetical protein [Halorubrum persicum]PHQ38841.1 hypothetical protein DJ69_09455 [Halorubrum persicum]